MYRFETVDLGAYRGDDCFLVGFVEPAPTATDSYVPRVDAEDHGVAVVRSADRPLDENVQIVRMDTTHGRPHLDRLYLPEDSDTAQKRWLDPEFGYDRMKAYLLENWTIFVDRYVRNRE